MVPLEGLVLSAPQVSASANEWAGALFFENLVRCRIFSHFVQAGSHSVFPKILFRNRDLKSVWNIVLDVGTSK